QVYRTFGLFRTAFAQKGDDCNSVLLPPIKNFKYFLKTLITYHQENILSSYEPNFEITNARNKVTYRKNNITKNKIITKYEIQVADYLKQYLPEVIEVIEDIEEYDNNEKYNKKEELEKVLIDYLIEDNKQIFEIRDI